MWVRGLTGRVEREEEDFCVSRKRMVNLSGVILIDLKVKLLLLFLSITFLV